MWSRSSSTRCSCTHRIHKGFPWQGTGIQLQTARRLPIRYGNRKSDVHEAELAALLGCVAAAPRGGSIVLAADRMALLDLVDHLGERSRLADCRANCLPLETRLRHLLRERERALQAPARVPDLEVLIGAKLGRHTKNFHATILVHTPSHQTDRTKPKLPCELLASLNDRVDTLCDVASKRGAPADVLKPSGGTRFTVEHLGKTVVGDPALAVRDWYSASAVIRLESLQVQGYVAARADGLWDLDLVPWRQTRIPEALLSVARELQPDLCSGQPMDLHRRIFKLRAGLGGSYISLSRRSAVFRSISNWITDDLDPEGQLCLL